MKRKIIITLSFILIIVSYIFYFGYYSPNHNISVLKADYSSSLLNDKMDNYKIIVFSDIKYDGNTENTDKVIEMINSRHPDLIIFAGDIFLTSSEADINEDDIKYITDKFSSLKAEYGKFAVYGDIDYKYPELISDILFGSGFELLDNQSIRISNQSSEYFNLVGLQPTINNEYESASVYQANTNEKLTITVCHTPDIFSEISDYTDILISAHTLGGEVVMPLIGPVNDINGYDKYYEGIHVENYSQIIICNGIGNESESRIFATPNIVELKLYSK